MRAQTLSDKQLDDFAHDKAVYKSYLALIHHTDNFLNQTLYWKQLFSHMKSRYSHKPASSKQTKIKGIAKPLTEEMFKKWMIEEFSKNIKVCDDMIVQSLRYIAVKAAGLIDDYEKLGDIFIDPTKNSKIKVLSTTINTPFAEFVNDFKSRWRGLYAFGEKKFAQDEGAGFAWFMVNSTPVNMTPDFDLDGPPQDENRNLMFAHLNVLMEAAGVDPAIKARVNKDKNYEDLTDEEYDDIPDRLLDVGFNKMLLGVRSEEERMRQRCVVARRIEEEEERLKNAELSGEKIAVEAAAERLRQYKEQDDLSEMMIYMDEDPEFDTLWKHSPPWLVERPIPGGPDPFMDQLMIAVFAEKAIDNTTSTESGKSNKGLPDASTVKSHAGVAVGTLLAALDAAWDEDGDGDEYFSDGYTSSDSEGYETADDDDGLTDSARGGGRHKKIKNKQKSKKKSKKKSRRR